MVARRAVLEAPLRESRHGLVADVDGWFVVNARDARWRDGDFGAFCDFEGKTRFRQLGINVDVLQPGQPLSLYHREQTQEGFLVLRGECLLIVEGERRALRAWDLFHCPGGTAHALVGAGTGPAVVVAIGARGGRRGLLYPRDGVAAAHGAAAERSTADPREAYAGHARPVRCRYRAGWLPDLREPPAAAREHAD